MPVYRYYIYYDSTDVLVSGDQPRPCGYRLLLFFIIIYMFIIVMSLHFFLLWKKKKLECSLSFERFTLYFTQVHGRLKSYGPV